LKFLFPGDTEFTVHNFWDLPYRYVLDAYDSGKKGQMRNLHALEAPTAQLSSIFANANRDSKKKREPYKMQDFFLFELKEDRNIPTGVYGAAAIELSIQNLLPPWALFVFKDLREGADDTPPRLLAYIADNAILLAPSHGEKTVRGMLIAKHSASKARIRMTSPCGKSILVDMPLVSDKVVAQEDVELSVVN